VKISYLPRVAGMDSPVILTAATIGDDEHFVDRSQQ